MVVHSCYPRYSGNIKRRITIQLSLDLNLRPFLKKLPKAKRAGVVSQVVKHLSCKGKALSSTPSTTKNKAEQQCKLL
jgi:hypothetical protein